ncbi:MAG: hypothetical protein HY747_08450 [Elusimicrobia bacterium]|nr:hypothetical protein [Elusimicrobiota bacterium]
MQIKWKIQRVNYQPILQATAQGKSSGILFAAPKVKTTFGVLTKQAASAGQTAADAQQTNAGSDEDVNAFKSELSRRIDSLGQEMLEVFTPTSNHSAIIGQLRDLRDTEEYETCADPGFFDSHSDQIRACLKLARKVEELAGLDSSEIAQRNQRVRRAETELLDFLLEADEGSDHQEFGRQEYQKLVDRYNEYNRAMNRLAQSHLDRMQSHCGSMSYGEGEACAIGELPTP